VLDVTRGAVRLQSGYVYHYAFAMLVGVLLISSWFIGGGEAFSALMSYLAKMVGG
jgi:NADH-quinone oxidoreductase subunit L